MTRAAAGLQRNQLFLLAAVLAVAAIISRGVFLRPSNLVLVIAIASAAALVFSFGQALVVISGGFDLAVVGGSIAVILTAVLAGLVSSQLVSRTKAAIHRHSWHAVSRRINVVAPGGGSADHGLRI